jgi:hypothetical protein
MIDDKIDNDKQMYLLCWSFQWPCGGMGAMPRALPNAACPELHPKPLDATIRQLLAPYCPKSHQGSMQNNNKKNTPTLLAILMAMAMRQYNTAHIAQWRRSRASLEATGCCHLASICFNNINWSCQHWFFQVFS